jgi:hypothetical protein
VHVLTFKEINNNYKSQFPDLICPSLLRLMHLDAVPYIGRLRCSCQNPCLQARGRICLEARLRPGRRSCLLLGGSLLVTLVFGLPHLAELLREQTHLREIVDSQRVHAPLPVLLLLLVLF